MQIAQAELEEIQALWMEAMRSGDFEAAWQQTDRIELRRRFWQARGSWEWQPHFLIWNGQPWAGREVVVHCNHGLGDTLQFLRFLPWLRKTASSIALRVQPELVDFLSEANLPAKILNGWSSEPAPPDALAMEIMELPYVFRVTQKTLPRDLPYVLPKPCPPMLERTGGLRIGVHWAASHWDPSRSIPLHYLKRISSLPGVSLYNLQQGPAKRSFPNAIPLWRRTRAIAQAAAALQELDLLITVDSMLAYLAGALGRPVWLLLKHEADWRWMRNRPDSPWYPGMRLFRQPRPGDWESLGDAVSLALGADF